MPWCMEPIDRMDSLGACRMYVRHWNCMRMVWFLGHAIIIYMHAPPADHGHTCSRG